MNIKMIKGKIVEFINLINEVKDKNKDKIFIDFLSKFENSLKSVNNNENLDYDYLEARFRGFIIWVGEYENYTDSEILYNKLCEIYDILDVAHQN